MIKLNEKDRNVGFYLFLCMFIIKINIMIENYDEIMSQWANPCVETCTNMMDVKPDEDLRRWSVKQTITVLANADYYYTKDEVNHLLEMITSQALTREEVQRMIKQAVASEADKSELDALDSNVYSKTEVDTMFGTYTQVDNHILYLHNN
jgi:hypothetical protein